MRRFFLSQGARYIVANLHLTWQGRYTEYWPRVLGLLDQRLDNAFEEISSKDRKDPAARKIAVTQYYVHNKLKEMKE